MDPSIPNIIDLLLPVKRDIWISETQDETSIAISAGGIRKVTYHVGEKIVRWGQSSENLNGCKNASNPLHCIRERRIRKLAGDCSNQCEEFFNTKEHKGQIISIMEDKEHVMVYLGSGLSCGGNIIQHEVSILCGTDELRPCVPRWQHGKLRRSFGVMDIG